MNWLIAVFLFIMWVTWTLVIFYAGAEAGQQTERKRMKARGCDECRNAWWRKHYGEGKVSP